MNNTRNIWQNFDFLLFGAGLILSILGIALIRSSIAGNIALADHPNRQTTFLIISLVVLFVVAAIDYKYWITLIAPMYLVIMAFLGVVLTAEARFGAVRWLEVGQILIQPSEFAKIVIILALSNTFANVKSNNLKVNTILRSALVVGGLLTLIFLQPNLSMTIVILVLWAAYLWIGGIKIRFTLIFVAIIMVVILIGAFTGFSFLEDYQRDRISNFLFPDPDARYGDTYNVDQALITIGTGGWFGQGYNQSSQVQLRFLKVRHTDFIFSVLAAEFGLIGTLIVIALLVLVIIRCFYISQNAADSFGSLIAYGFGVLIFFQTAVNIGVNLNIIPVTGLTLPFISYGGSSLLTLFLGIGMVESVAMRSPKRK
ncbi:MAG TPA: FtsW/RodA/SpoVE family cell cycle protein [Brevefilum fermentans]|jgi:rod shape determining protein RodA|uniref:Rod shape-determining protein RodA n=1 Tax=Candidatus Brevifilum fermentans TaxID=1986204 RepID=A0A1Y6K6Q4_9CHLR|nr:FtsW/RodA/SpoVE family cell cycle protein [Brevefilum fermentans]MDI9566472.1 FtsW/RodA/SpoVE family cell cycle protein [Chloroflexota bacterium]SMX54537.1 Rod shape-determining protein RodA [Brevefilum fermentans]HQA29414.1 FtsW/RodA/SpoVE family cell cycle protein [Brevefilum fermentans]